MMIKFDETSRVNGLLDIVNMDTNDINLPFLSDKLVEISKA